MLRMNRLNHILVDRHYIKKETPFLVFRENCKLRGFNVKWGLDLDKWGYGNIPIIGKYQEQGIWFGYKLANQDMDLSVATIHVYDFSFATERIIKELRYRNYYAMVKQSCLKYRQAPISKMMESENLKYKMNHVFGNWKQSIISNFEKRQQTELKLEMHPAVMHEKIKTMTSDMFGYGAFEWLKIKKASYFL